MIRYADNLVLAVRASREDAQSLPNDIGELLGSNLKITLSADKTLFTCIDTRFDSSASTSPRSTARLPLGSGYRHAAARLIGAVGGFLGWASAMRAFESFP